MKWTRVSALSFAATTAFSALTLPGLVYTPAAVSAPAAVTRPAPSDDGFTRPHPMVVSAKPVAQPMRWWKVRSGDTLSSIAQARYGTQAAWTLIYWTNHKHIRWANQIQVGQSFYLPDYNGTPPRAPRLLEPPPPPAPPAVVASSSHQVYHSTYHHYRHHHYRSSGTYHGSGSMQRCIIARESGGNSQVMNSSGHYGLYQFSYSTWVASGGNPSSFGNASVAEQNQAYYTAVAKRGYSDWSRYDGC